MGMSVVGIIALICAIWVIYDILTKQKRMPGLHKLLWIIGAVVFSIITAIVYFLVVKKGKL